jgi:hypothetical protein
MDQQGSPVRFYPKCKGRCVREGRSYQCQEYRC